MNENALNTVTLVLTKLEALALNDLLHDTISTGDMDPEIKGAVTREVVAALDAAARRADDAPEVTDIVQEYDAGTDPWAEEAVGAWTAEAIRQGFGRDLWTVIRVLDGPYETGMAAASLRIGSTDYMLIVESVSPARRSVRIE